MYVPGETREEYGGLTGGIPSAHNGDLFVFAQQAFHLSRAVVDAVAFELLQIGQIQLAILRARRDDDAAALHVSAVVQIDGVGRGLALQSAEIGRASCRERV